MASTYSDSFENFWARYGLDESISSVRKGSKHTANLSWVKRCKEWAKRENIFEDAETVFSQAVWRGYEAQRANRRALKASKAFCPELPMAATWLNQWRFEMELDRSTGDMKREAALSSRQACSRGSCPNPTFGRDEQGRWICREHDLLDWEKTHGDIVAEQLKRFPILPAETLHDWAFRVLRKTPLGTALTKWMEAPRDTPRGEA